MTNPCIQFLYVLHLTMQIATCITHTVHFFAETLLLPDR